MNQENARRATARGEQLRTELVERLRRQPQTAEELLPQLKTPGLSLSEVVFQLGRLEEEHRAAGDRVGVYRLSSGRSG